MTTGLCFAHYQRKRKGTDMTRPITPYRRLGADPEGLPCGVQECERGAAIRGFCRLHYARLRKHGDPLLVNKRGAKRVRVDLPDETSPSKLARILGVSRQRAHQILNRDAHLARHAVTAAVKAGRLVRPAACERCGTKSRRLEAHHWDYREALDVRWVCPPCHSIVHSHHPTVHGKSNQPTAR